MSRIIPSNKRLIDWGENLEEKHGKQLWMPPRLKVGFLRQNGRPLDKLIISSTYGMRGDRMHKGIDVAIPTGVDIYAPETNNQVKYIVTRVVRNANLDPGGIYVSLYKEGLTHTFMHLSSIAENLKVGDKIAPGTFIGKSGNTGRSTGPHLHYQISVGQSVSGNCKNPISFLFLHDLNVGGVTRERITASQAAERRWQMSYDIVHDPTWIGVYNPLREGQDSPIIIVGDNDFMNASPEEPYEIGSGDYQFWPYNKSSAERDISVTFDFGATEDLSGGGVGGGGGGVGFADDAKMLRGIWQITKCIIDGSVENRQVIDSSLSLLSGSFMNFFKKVCQPPFVEMFGDTYGSMYYWVVRKPPTDREGIMRLINSAIELDPQDIMRTSLQFEDGAQAYAWYQLIPTMEVISQSRANQFMPAVFFPAYADVWGSKPMVVQSNYYEYKNGRKRFSDKDANAKKASEGILRTAVRDLKYIVDSNACSPFLRKGTITLRGDRRIKVGTCVVLPGRSSEVFLVDSVSQSYSISGNNVSRQTNISVSRGMVIDYLFGKEVDGVTMSYYDLIDYGKKEDGSEFDIETDLTETNYQTYMSKWKVNMKVFEFFLKRKHIQM